MKAWDRSKVKKRWATDSLYEVLQTQLNSESGLANTTIAEHHNLVGRCKPSRHVQSRRRGPERGSGPGTAVGMVESKRLGRLERIVDLVVR